MRIKLKPLCVNCRYFRPRAEPRQKIAGVSDLADGQCSAPVIGKPPKAFRPWRHRMDSCDQFLTNEELIQKPSATNP